VLFHEVEFQPEEFQLDEFQLDESQSVVAFQLDEFQLELFHEELFQLDEFQLDESQLEATVLPLRQALPGAQTSAGTPWFARPGVPARLYEELRLSEPVFESFGFAPCLAISTHLTLSGLYSGCAWRMIAAAPATCGAAKEVPLIVT
jgi:hypothetical protein